MRAVVARRLRRRAAAEHHGVKVSRIVVARDLAAALGVPPVEQDATGRTYRASKRAYTHRGWSA